MITFLTKISQLPSIQRVLLLSTRGELLFSNHSNETDESIASWRAIISGLNSPVEAELFSEKGGYYLHTTELGYVIVGMNGFSRLANIKTACDNLQAKLSDLAICRKVLLRMLQDADEKLKPRFVMTLFPFANEEIAEKLIVFLGKDVSFSAGIRVKFLVSICQVLGQCGSPAARRALKKMLQEHYSGQTALENDVRYAAQVALAQLELDLPPESATAPHQTDNPVKKVLSEHKAPIAAPPPAENQWIDEVPAGQKIQGLLNESRKSEAIALLLDQIALCAGKKQFDLAEQLREWLIQIDSTSIREIIRAAEIIEEEKSASISDEHLDIWRKLANTLSPEEFSSLHHAMVHKSFNNGEIVVYQGNFVSTLFFVNSGRVQLYSASHGGEYPLKIVEAGEIFGAETFFDISIWTMSARSLGADISLLTWDRLLKLKDGNPALQTKLLDFCTQFKLTNVAFDKAATTRRRFDRIKVSGKVAFSLVKKAGEESLFGTKGNLLDISRGGLAFSLRFSKKKNAIALLGQDLSVNVRTDVSTESIHRKGVVKAVQCYDFVGNDYTIHMEFKDALSNAELSQAVGRKR